MRDRSICLLVAFGLSACEPEVQETVEDPIAGFRVNDAADDEAPSIPAETEEAGCGIVVSTPRELMIRNLGVVEDPVRTTWNGDPADPVSGAWHFGKLMTHMAGDRDPSVFVRNWLAHWETDVVVNGQTVPARTAITDIIDDWPKLADGKLDLTQPPLRLLAIVNRIDLRDDDDAGEGRFVFGVLQNGVPLSFTVILEYDLPLEVQPLADWAADWHALGALTPGSTAYNEALQGITDAFTGPDVLPARPNGSAISQVRTNEIALAGPWELREFRIGAAGRLKQRAVALTPNRSFEGTDALARFVNANEAEILAGTNNVPVTFEGVPFRAGSITNNIDSWSAPGIVNPEARHLLSLNTCNGCHGSETSTAFLQINNRSAGQQAVLSGFLTGVTVTDPVDGVTQRTFDDLGRRRDDLSALLCP